MELNSEPVKGHVGRPHLLALGIALLASSWLWIAPVYMPMPGGRLLGSGLAGLGWVFVAMAIPTATLVSRLLIATLLLGATGAGNEALVHIETINNWTLEPIAWISSWLLRSNGEVVDVQGGAVLFDHGQGGFVFAATIGNVGLRPMLLLMGCCLLVSSLHDPRSKWRMLGMGGLGLLLMSLRFAHRISSFVSVESVLAENEHSPLSYFFEPWLITGVVILMALAWSTGLVWRSQVSMEMTARSCAPALLGGILIGLVLHWGPGGETKLGRVVIDDRLSGEWEPAGRLLTKDRFGDFSTYSFASMTEYLARYFSVSVNHEDAYTPEYLSRIDVLILKTPKFGLDVDEVSAIQEWVLGGGGLFVIGDHTDLGGMSTYLNELTADFGMRFRFDSVAPLMGGGATWWRERLLSEHPVVYGLGEFSTLTACSIEMSGDAGPVMIAYESDASAGDYSLNSNFGKVEPEPGRSQGAMVIAAEATPGEGRVITFGDSTCLSSFSFYRDQHDLFVLRSVTWLNRSGGGAKLSVPLLILICGVILFLAVGSYPRPQLIFAVPILAVGIIAGWWSTCSLQGRLLQPPPRLEETVDVGFLAMGESVALPPVLGSSPDTQPGVNLSTLVQIPQRYGFSTRLVENDLDELPGLEILMVLNPESSHGEPWIAAVRKWVLGGGKLIVTTGVDHAGHDHGGHDHNLATQYTEGLSLKHVEGLQSEITAHHASVGKGSVTVIGPAEQLDVSHLGHCMAVPQVEQRLRWEDLYHILDEVVKVPQIERRLYIP